MTHRYLLPPLIFGAIGGMTYLANLVLHQVRRPSHPLHWIDASESCTDYHTGSQKLRVHATHGQQGGCFEPLCGMLNQPLTMNCAHHQDENYKNVVDFIGCLSSFTSSTVRDATQPHGSTPPSSHGWSGQWFTNRLN